MKIKKVLVTGASGFLGRHVIHRLRSNFDLTLFDRADPEREALGFPFIRGDITDLETIKKACAGQDAVVHLVALVRDRFGKSLHDFTKIMVEGTWNVAEACKKQEVLRLVNISSILACGWPRDTSKAYRVGEASEFYRGDLRYCLSKRIGEEIGIAYRQAFGLSVINLRLGVLAGDGVNQEPDPPFESNGRWFVHVDPRDAAQGVERALNAPVYYGCYNLVAGRKDSLFDWKSARDEIGYRPEFNWPEISQSRRRKQKKRRKGMGLKGKTVLVTGASRGLGRAIAEAFLRAKAKVVAWGRDPKAMADTRKAFRAIGGSFKMVRMDVTNEKAVVSTIKKMKNLDILVNNAGIARIRPFLHTKSDELREVLNVNVIGAFVVMRESARKMLEQGSGHIINIASDAATRGISRMTAYVGSKHALVGMGKSLRLELREKGIRVTNFCPGSIATDIFGPGTANQNFLSPGEVAKTIVHLAESGENLDIQEMLVQPVLR